MLRDEFIRAATLGGPGLDGYAYCGDVLCVTCGRDTIEDIAAEVAPRLCGTDDPGFSDSELIPQPIFFGESDCAQYCAECCAYLYGDDDED
jgi:hypothetical protein